MKKPTVAAAVAAILSIGLSAPLWAQSTSSDAKPLGAQSGSRTGMNAQNSDKSTSEPNESKAKTEQTSTTGVINRHDYVDKEVVTAAGIKVGDVTKLVTSNSDHGVYAVLGASGFLDMGKKQVAIPIKQLQLQGGNLVLPASITRSSLKSGPIYTKSKFSTYEATRPTKAMMGGGGYGTGGK